MAKLYKPPYVKKILISQKEIEKGILKAAQWVNQRYAHCAKPPILLAILKGSVPFYGKLVMSLNIECCFDFMVLSSYRGGIKPVTKAQIMSDICGEIHNRDVIVIEDVLDSGQTLSLLLKHLKSKKPKSLKLMVLVDKPSLRKVKIKADYACFTLKGSPFIIGYGLDVKERARNLPYIAEFDVKYINKI